MTENEMIAMCIMFPKDLVDEINLVSKKLMINKSSIVRMGTKNFCKKQIGEKEIGELNK